jgi:hypothetical protein
VDPPNPLEPNAELVAAAAGAADWPKADWPNPD